MDPSSEGIPAEDSATEGVPTEDASKKKAEPRRMHFFFSQTEIEQLQKKVDAVRVESNPIPHKYAKLDDGTLQRFSGCCCITGDDDASVPTYPYADRQYLGKGVWSHCEKDPASASSNDGEGALLITLHQKGERMDTET